MDKPRSDDGQQPYCFVAYAHRDDDAVYDDIRWMQSSGFAIVFDEGIHPGQYWTDQIASQIQGATGVLFYASEAACQSEYCRRELDFAIEEGKPVMAVYLDDAPVPAGIRLSLNHRQALHRHRLEEVRYREQLRRWLEAPGSAPAADSTAGAAQPVPPMPPLPAKPASSAHRISIAVAAAETADAHGKVIVRAATRYLSWQSGAWRASTSRTGEANYELQIDSFNGDRQTIDWQLHHSASGDVVGGREQQFPADSFASTRSRIAESIIEEVLRLCSAREVSAAKALPVEALTWPQLVLTAEQLNYLDATDMQRKLDAVQRAQTLEPGNGYPDAVLAGLLSWRVINRVSEDEATDKERIQQACQRAHQQSPDDAAVLLQIGTTWCRLGDYDKGLALLRRACDLAPTSTARDQLARSLSFAGEADEAVELFEKLVRETPAGHAYPTVRLAIALTQAGRLEEALPHALASTVHYPNDYYGWCVLANLQQQAGDTSTAKESFEKGKALNPSTNLHALIRETERTYGRRHEQKTWLTSGLRRLL